MSEYNANDHLHNVTASIQQLTYQAQGVQDITGANVADYEQISPDAASSVTLSNARKDVPFLALINNLPPIQDGEGTPALDNVRELIPYTKSIVNNGSDVPPIEIDLPDDFWGGSVDLVNGQINSDIVRRRIPVNGKAAGVTTSWQYTESSGNYSLIDTDDIPDFPDTANARYITGENCDIQYGGSSGVTDGKFVMSTLLNVRRIYFKPTEAMEIESVSDLEQYLTDHELYYYMRVANPVVTPIPTTIPYVLDNSYTVSAEYGTLTVKYQGIAPDEP